MVAPLLMRVDHAGVIGLGDAVRREADGARSAHRGIPLTGTQETRGPDPETVAKRWAERKALRRSRKAAGRETRTVKDSSRHW